jgi:Enoyl-(Acyl carrier protein) reductase
MAKAFLLRRFAREVTSGSSKRCAGRVGIGERLCARLSSSDTVQKAVPLMSKGSAIVLSASINAHIGMPGTTVYGATKAAVSGSPEFENHCLVFAFEN